MQAWSYILDLFEGTDRSGSSSFWNILKSTVTGCNVRRQAPLTFADMDAEIASTQALKSLRDACGDDVDKIIERIHCEIRVAAFKDLSNRARPYC